MKTTHYAQAILAGLIQGLVVAAILLPAPLGHYMLVGAVILVAVLSPMGIVSPSALTPDPQIAAAAGGAAGPAVAVAVAPGKTS